MTDSPDKSSTPRALRPFLLGVRPPGRGAERLVQLRFVRDLQVRSLLLSIPLCIIVVLVVDGSWVPIVLGVVLLAGLLETAYLTLVLARAASANGEKRV